MVICKWLNEKKVLKNAIKIVVLKSLKKIDEEISSKLSKIGFEAKESQTAFLDDVLYVGTNVLKNEDLKIAFSTAIRTIQKTKYEKILINLKNLELKDIVEGLILGSYSFKTYKSKKDEEKEFSVHINISSSSKEKEVLEKELEEALIVSNSVNMVRDIINTPPEDFYPESMAIKAKELAYENNLECKVFGEDYLKENGMNSMLAVGRASRHESKLIHLSYKPENPKGKVVVVGKGLTYDSGGLSLKIGGGMLSMKCDKSGGTAVLGLLNAVSKLKLDVEVHGIIGAVENMIGGDAYKPDDVLTAKNGVTIEVTNTDAEGRLVLADCLCYAQDEIEDIDSIFDIATLTGACIVALGDYTTGVMGHSEKMKKKLQKASDKSGELVGFLPYNRYLPAMLKSQIADIVNSPGSRSGSSITASLFLDNFIKKENKKKWLHLDIAGAAYRDKVWGYNPYGATGVGVRLLVEYIKAI